MTTKQAAAVVEYDVISVKRVVDSDRVTLELGEVLPDLDDSAWDDWEGTGFEYIGKHSGDIDHNEGPVVEVNFPVEPGDKLRITVERI